MLPTFLHNFFAKHDGCFCPAQGSAGFTVPMWIYGDDGKSAEKAPARSSSNPDKVKKKRILCETASCVCVRLLVFKLYFYSLGNKYLNASTSFEMEALVRPTILGPEIEFLGRHGKPTTPLHLLLTFLDWKSGVGERYRVDAMMSASYLPPSIFLSMTSIKRRPEEYST